MEKKIVFAFVLVILLVATILPLTQAESAYTHEEVINNLDFISQIKYSITQGFFFFTAEGDSRYCGVDQNGRLPWDGDPHCDEDIDPAQSGWTYVYKSDLCNQCSGRVCGLDEDKKCNGGLVDFYTYSNGVWTFIGEHHMENDFPVSFYLNGKPLRYEVYCCQCERYSSCSEEECEDGERKNYVCRGNDIYSNYCDDGEWIDKKLKTCNSPEFCSTPDVYDGECSSPSGYCGDGLCNNGETKTDCCKDCGCNSGYTCRYNHCELTCTPQCSGKSCGSDGCGGFCGTCNSGYTCNTQGQCIQDQQPKAQFEITSGPTFSKTSGKPGESIPVTVTIKNIGTVSGTYYIESGIAKKGLGGYAIGGNLFDLYSVVNFKCCSENEFYDGKKVTLGVGQQETVTVYPKVPNENSRDPPSCNNQGSVWSGYGSNYYIGSNACNNCYGEANHNCVLMNWQTTFTVEEEVQLYCGDGSCNNGETKTDCCLDCGCATGKQCDEVNLKCITPPPVEECGDDIVNSEEQCDGTDLDGSSCTSLGYDSGSLSCSNYCLFNTENCVDDTPDDPPENDTSKEICVTFANDIIKPITKSDNCTTNSIIFIIGAFVIFMVLISLIKK